MVKSKVTEIQSFSKIQVIYLLFICSFFCQLSWASQDAMVMAEKAVIYSDREMTSPVGYITRGKKIVVGEIPRNKGQVYPIVVSGKVAYIRVIDITTEKESISAPRLTAERFLKNTKSAPETKVVASYFAYSSQINLDNEEVVGDKEALLWHGASLKTEVLVKERFDVQLLLNYMTTTEEDAKFNVFELGAGGAFRLLDFKKFLLRAEAQALAVPFSSYAVKDDFRVKSYGYSVGAGLAMTVLFDKHWGLEAFGGVYQTKIFGFKAPSPYEDIAPTFVGNRFGVGLNFTY